ncbi:MAG: hypothetical protein ACD_17C00148G0002 [uncultured bacterium]|nr:MAG: hypothetical protein ACD_17C00148G0002 [uncultured bacterium]OGN56245.1 MAG: hypothetical protein A2796_04885 [Chlamydiae bacterium RIFCSPHIGHO2_01_FULL_44_39]OGN57081.1 MAG: hypothetical protein A3C42_06950 [Chlamydiae bacterium RIFCSPHIGHO2_02_FULL_45_9]OGN60717.1 MAG: hypothetical protein A3D96_02195 [Chlamydiae bacterium RIFCSPHIGHO2_12_FULL_44_59]OGN66977.1 MAG: hypothetical protein A2978_02425 [Chlamydiae bacterium RIFCSPLOWO2_01_FULL_44_52]OGN67528.1 MAG: hypothetical protein A3
MWKRFFAVIFALLLGLWFGGLAKKEPLCQLHAAQEYPVKEHKSFVLVVYAHNGALWCERSLQSIFGQDYDHYRVIVIDDGSVDGTYAKAKDFILKNQQDQKVILVQNEKALGPIASLYRAVDNCLDREIVIPLDAKDWLSSPDVLHRLNAAYQDPDAWLVFGKTILYPSYTIEQDSRASFYAALFKELLLEDLYHKGHFATSIASYQLPLVDLAHGRIRFLEDPITFTNQTYVSKKIEEHIVAKKQEPLSSFPSKEGFSRADILVFSFDRPLQLYACLESIQRYITGFQHLTVLFRASSDTFADAYRKVMDDFPKVRFVMQSMKDPKHDFKPNVHKIVFHSPSEYILFSVDDIIVKDFVDLQYCVDQLEKTGAYGFYLRLGQNITHCYQFDQDQAVPQSHPLSEGLYAWDFSTGECDWGFPNTLDMTLFRKVDIQKPFGELKYKTPNSLEYNWAAEFPPAAKIGLYFEESKLVNIPMNVVGRTGNPHMNYLDKEELLAKFTEGFRINIDPLYRMENNSPHCDYIPEFITPMAPR